MNDKSANPPASEDGSPRCAVATGSLPGSSAAYLLAIWAARISTAHENLKIRKCREHAQAYWAEIDALLLCSKELRRELARATERQSEENDEVSRTAGK